MGYSGARPSVGVHEIQIQNTSKVSLETEETNLKLQKQQKITHAIYCILP